MNKLYPKLVTNRLFYVLLIVFGVFYLFSLADRYIEDDEAVLGEYSYYFLKEGVVKWKTLPGILNFDERVYPHHRFYTWSGAAVIQLFGWSINALKTSTLVWYALFFIFLYQYFRISDVENKKQHFIIAACIIFTAPIIILKSFSFRPDVLLMAEGMAVLYFIKRYRVKNTLLSIVLAGAFAGLAFLTHINGISFCVAGFFLLLILKEYKAMAVFTISGAVVGALYFIELLPAGNFEGYMYQLTNWPTVNHGENYLGGSVWSLIEGRVVKLLSEHRRFFWGDRVLAFSILFFVALIFNFKTLKKKDQEVFWYMILLVPALNIFGSHVAERYLLFYYGPMAVITAIWIYDLKFSSNAILRSLTLILLVLHLAFAGKMLTELYTRSYNYTEKHKEVLARIPASDAKILAPYAFIFNELVNYDLYAYKTYEYMQEEMDHLMTPEEFFTTADSLGMEYIVMNEIVRDKKFTEWMKDWEVDPNEHYRVLYQDEEHIILENISTAD